MNTNVHDLNRIPFHDVLSLYDKHINTLKEEKEAEEKNKEKMKASMGKVSKPRMK